MTRTANPPSGDARRSRAAFMVGAGIFFSRISGLIRGVLMASFFGTGLMDVWFAAAKIPNVIQNLLGEGTLSASVIPVYTEFLEEGREEEAGRFAGAVLGILMMVAGGAALLGMLLAPVLVPIVFWEWNPDKVALTTVIVQILFPMTAVLVLSAWALAILNSHRRFLVSYMAPVVWNGAIIATLVVMGLGFGFGWSGRQLLLAAAWGAVGGGILQFLVQLPYVVPLLRHFRLSLDRSVSGVGEAVRNFVPVVTARGVVNIGSLLDVFVAAILAEGAVAALGWAQTLYLLPISLFGMSIAASELPELSRQRKAPVSDLAPQISAALQRIHFLLLPSMAAFLLLGDLFIGGLYQRGEFLPTDTPVVYAVLAAYALGLLASSGSRVLSSAFYAMRDTRTPARIAYLRVVVSLAVGISLMFPLDRFTSGELHYGATGLALGASVAAWLEYVLLRRRLATVLGPHGPARSARISILGATAVAALAAVAAKWTLGSNVPRHDGMVSGLLGDSAPWLVQPALAVSTAFIFGVVYLTVASRLGVGAPLRQLLGRRPKHS
ncbi:MAG: murein biosynthesis integral membrane protein MurJ [Gemmatimonadetes bacterium]|nr:murein biosynthesis integral membrane protein MurJ [Gemmatimonadota bacterium]